jgi:hypothetical protein
LILRVKRAAPETIAMLLLLNDWLVAIRDEGDFRVNVHGVVVGVVGDF